MTIHDTLNTINMDYNLVQQFTAMFSPNIIIAYAIELAAVFYQGHIREHLISCLTTTEFRSLSTSAPSTQRWTPESRTIRPTQLNNTLTPTPVHNRLSPLTAAVPSTAATAGLSRSKSETKSKTMEIRPMHET